MYRLTLLLVIQFFLTGSLYAQELKSSDSAFYYKDYLFVREGDTVVVELEEVQLLAPLKFETDYDRRYYYWFRKKTLKAYPYAVTASEKLIALNDSLTSIKSKRKKSKYIREMQKYLEGEFEGQLKKLTRTEGRILIKLIHRQTGSTVYDLIKEYKSGWRAFWYNSTASLFKLSLKAEYHPEEVQEDFLIEDILQRAFLNDVLEKHESKLDFDYFKIVREQQHVFHFEQD